MPSRKTKKFRRDRTEISCCLKYSIFSVNVVCWVIFTRSQKLVYNLTSVDNKHFYLQIFGLCLLSVGVWALNEKNVFSNLTSNLLYDPAFVLIVSGTVTFSIGKNGNLEFVVVCCRRRLSRVFVSFRIYWMCWIIERKYFSIIACKSHQERHRPLTHMSPLAVLDTPDSLVIAGSWIRCVNVYPQRQRLD